MYMLLKLENHPPNLLLGQLTLKWSQSRSPHPSHPPALSDSFKRFECGKLSQNNLEFCMHGRQGAGGEVSLDGTPSHDPHIFARARPEIGFVQRFS